MNGEKQESQQSSSQSTNALPDWSKSEKYELLQVLKNNGSRDVAAIHSAIPTKSITQIKAALAYYRSIAFKEPSTNAKRRRQKADYNIQSSLPLSNWAKLLIENFTFEELQTETAAALRLIADFDTIPPAVCTDDLDFRKAYLLLANAVEGKPLMEDKLLLLLINKCIIETTLQSKAFIRPPILRHVIEHIDIKDKESKNFPRSTTSSELATLLNLACQTNYNPLNIADDFLTAAGSIRENK